MQGCVFVGRAEVEVAVTVVLLSRLDVSSVAVGEGVIKTVPLVVSVRFLTSVIVPSAVATDVDMPEMYVTSDV